MKTYANTRFFGRLPLYMSLCMIYCGGAVHGNLAKANAILNCQNIDKFVALGIWVYETAPYKRVSI